MLRSIFVAKLILTILLNTTKHKLFYLRTQKFVNALKSGLVLTVRTSFILFPIVPLLDTLLAADDVAFDALDCLHSYLHADNTLKISARVCLYQLAS